MFEYFSNTDFFTFIKKHAKYIKVKTSGSFQIAYSFNIPMILEKKFAEKYGFNN